MALFNRNKGKSNQPPPSNTELNTAFLARLKEKLEAQGIPVTNHTQFAALVVDGEIDIASAVMEGDFHPALLPMMVVTIHPRYFPNGMQESLTGLGMTVEEKIETAVDNYLGSVFPPIWDSFSDTHQPDLDFKALVAGREILWHPKPGPLNLQGKWQNQESGKALYEIVKSQVSTKLKDQKLNWLKMYIARQPDGTFAIDCRFNDEDWTEGIKMMEAFGKTWPQTKEFLSKKQFVMFRRCDAFDPK